MPTTENRARILASMLWSACVVIPVRSREQLDQVAWDGLDHLAPRANLGDIDGDGIPDFAAGARFRSSIAIG